MRKIKLAIRQLLGARKYSASYHIILYRNILSDSIWRLTPITTSNAQTADAT